MAGESQEPVESGEEPLCPQRRPHQQADALSGQAAGSQLCSQISGGAEAEAALVPQYRTSLARFPKGLRSETPLSSRSINRKLACSSKLQPDPFLPQNCWRQCPGLCCTCRRGAPGRRHSSFCPAV